MARTTEAAVIAVLMRDYDSLNAPSLSPFISTATLIVNRAVASALLGEYPLTATEAERIECWLAAHFYACSDKPFASKMTMKTGAKFDGVTGTKFAATLYGQTAMALDLSGYLNSIGGDSGGSDGAGGGIIKVASLGSGSCNPCSPYTRNRYAGQGAPEITASGASMLSTAPTLTINGRFFDSIAGNNAIELSSGTGTITDASATQLTLTFATAPSLGNLTAIITNSNGTSYQQQIATVI